jgi:hypothetical protein
MGQVQCHRAKNSATGRKSIFLLQGFFLVCQKPSEKAKRMAEVHEVELGGPEGGVVPGGAKAVQSVPGDGTDALRAEGDVAAGGAPVAPSFAFSAGQVQEAMLATNGALAPQSAEVHENLMPMQRTLVYRYIGDYGVALASSLAAYVQVVCMCACMCG